MSCNVCKRCFRHAFHLHRSLPSLGSIALAESWEACAIKGQIFQQAAEDGARTGITRKYAPDRRVDVKHLKLDLTPDFENANLSGIATLTFTPIAEAVSEINSMRLISASAR